MYRQSNAMKCILLKLFQSGGLQREVLHGLKSSKDFGKTFITINKDSGVRPFVLLARLLKKFNYLSKEEFMYLFPLCINRETTEFIENKLSEFRGKDVNVGEIVTEIFMQQQNYKDALDYFVSEKSVSEKIIQRCR